MFVNFRLKRFELRHVEQIKVERREIHDVQQILILVMISV